MVLSPPVAEQRPLAQCGAAAFEKHRGLLSLGMGGRTSEHLPVERRAGSKCSGQTTSRT